MKGVVFAMSKHDMKIMGKPTAEAGFHSLEDFEQWKLCYPEGKG